MQGAVFGAHREKSVYLLKCLWHEEMSKMQSEVAQVPIRKLDIRARTGSAQPR